MSSESPKQRLASVLEALDPNRGPDVHVKTSVPQAWLVGRASIRVVLPRLAACAACNGGGCERCLAKGALPLRGIGDPPIEVEVHLHPTQDGQALLLRLPELGPESTVEGPRGCVLLEVSPGEAAKNVSLVTVATDEWKPAALPWLVLLVALGLLLLFAAVVACR